MQIGCRAKNGGCQRGPRSLAETHAEVQKWALADFLKQPRMRELGGAMSGHTVIERRRFRLMENSGGSAGDIAVNENGDALVARGEDGTCHGSDLAPAQPAQDFERVGDVLQMQVKSAPHRIDLALETGTIDTGAAANPVLGPAAVERAGHSGRNGGVANTHFANAQKVGAGNGLHAKSNGGSAVGFIECGIERYVASWRFQSEFEHLQPQAEGTAELIYSGATRLKVGYHLSGDLGGIGTDAVSHNAVIAGKHYYNGIVDAGRVPSLPGREPFGEFFQAA